MTYLRQLLREFVKIILITILVFGTIIVLIINFL
jgi:hypothetical protein